MDLKLVRKGLDRLDSQALRDDDSKEYRHAISFDAEGIGMVEDYITKDRLFTFSNEEDMEKKFRANLDSKAIAKRGDIVEILVATSPEEFIVGDKLQVIEVGLDFVTAHSFDVDGIFRQTTLMLGEFKVI